MTEQKEQFPRIEVVTTLKEMTPVEFFRGTFLTAELAGLGYDIKLEQVSSGKSDKIDVEVTGKRFEINDFNTLLSELMRDPETPIRQRLIQYHDVTF